MQDPLRPPVAMAQHIPRAPLSDYVLAIWSVRGRVDFQREKVLPNGVIELIINLGPFHKVVDPLDDSQFRLYRQAWIAGMQERFLVIEALDYTNLIGIRFKPGGATPFLRFSPADVTNYVVESAEVFGDLIEAARERLLSLTSPQARFAALEALLLDRLDCDWTPDPVVAFTLASLRGPSPLPIRAISQEVGLTHKHLVARFRRDVGITPKLLSEVFRLQRTIAAVAGKQQVSWAEIAQEAGYYDQSHLIHDFHKFTGAAPSTYLATRYEDDANHMKVVS